MAENTQNCQVEAVVQEVGTDNKIGTTADAAKEITQENVPFTGRNCLPCPMKPRGDVGIWSILKHCIGKELSKITMPITFNEPLSFLQRLAEYMEYCFLLQLASNSEDPVERQELVTAFAVSACASNYERIGKPFNPLLGETYELVRDDLGFRMICEQVSHHPPVSAFHVESPLYIFHGSIHPKLKFWGKSVEVTPKGTVTLYLKRHCECYSWQFVNVCIHNIIVGTLWIELYGTMEVVNSQNGLKSVVNFHESGWFGKDLHKVSGQLKDQNKDLRIFYGKWTDVFYSYLVEVWADYQKLIEDHPDAHLKSPSGKDERLNNIMPKSSFSGRASLSKSFSEPSMTNNDNPENKISLGKFRNLRLPGQKALWFVNSRPSNNREYYGFSEFAMNLNAFDDKTKHLLAPTDSRLRPDIRFMEEGKMDEAASEKSRLEQKQRVAKKEQKKLQITPQPVWFACGKNPHTGKEEWIFRNQYWSRDWRKCPDIF